MRDLGSMSRCAAWRGGASTDSVRTSGVPLDDEGQAHLKPVKNLFFLVSSLLGFVCRLILGSWNSTDGYGAMGIGDAKKKRLSQPRGHQREFHAGEGEDGAPGTHRPLLECRPPALAGAVQKNAEVVKKNQPPRQPPEHEPGEPSIKENLFFGRRNWAAAYGAAVGEAEKKIKRLSRPRRRQQGLTTVEGVVEDGAPTKVPPLMDDRPPEWGGADHEDAEVEVKERQPPRQPPEQELNIGAEFCVDDNIGVSTTFGRCGSLHQLSDRLYHWSVTATRCLRCLLHATWLSNSSNQVRDLSADCIINADERTDEIVDVVERGAPSAEQSIDDGVEEFLDAAEEIQGVEFEEVEDRIAAEEIQDGVGFEEVEDRIAADEDITVNLGGPAGEPRLLSGLTLDNYKLIVLKWCPRLDE